jgi:hypothetical protein
MKKMILLVSVVTSLLAGTSAQAKQADLVFTYTCDQAQVDAIQAGNPSEMSKFAQQYRAAHEMREVTVKSLLEIAEKYGVTTQGLAAQLAFPTKQEEFKKDMPEIQYNFVALLYVNTFLENFQKCADVWPK